MLTLEARQYIWNICIASILIYGCFALHSQIFLLVNRTIASCAIPCMYVSRWLMRPIERWRDRRYTRELLYTYLEKQAEELQELRAQLIATQATLRERTDTQFVDEFKSRYNTEYMIRAQIIMKYVSDERQIFWINVGSAQGITLDMVVVYGNCLLGRITEIYPHMSYVTLITDRMSKVPAICCTTGARGIYEGTNSETRTQLCFVSHLDTLAVDDIVISSGEGSIYPKGFALGKIKSFELDRRGLQYVIAMEPLLTLKDIHYCYVIQKGAELISQTKDETEINESTCPV